jgi:hypothetical protein
MLPSSCDFYKLKKISAVNIINERRVNTSDVFSALGGMKRRVKI